MFPVFASIALISFAFLVLGVFLSTPNQASYFNFFYLPSYGFAQFEYLLLTRRDDQSVLHPTTNRQSEWPFGGFASWRCSAPDWRQLGHLFEEPPDSVSQSGSVDPFSHFVIPCQLFSGPILHIHWRRLRLGESEPHWLVHLRARFHSLVLWGETGAQVTATHFCHCCLCVQANIWNESR